MKYTIKRKNELSPSRWSGGSTTELFIHPTGASYKERNFDVRISSATIDCERSVFTDLPNYHRILMTLDKPTTLCFEGQNTLCFEGQDKVLLRPFESIEFDGGVKTTSEGACTDIGIMLSKGYLGGLKAVCGGLHGCVEGFTCLYSLCDNVKVVMGDEAHSLQRGDFLVAETASNDQITLEATQNNAAILVYASKKD